MQGFHCKCQRPQLIFCPVGMLSLKTPQFLSSIWGVTLGQVMTCDPHMFSSNLHIHHALQVVFAAASRAVSINGSPHSQEQAKYMDVMTCPVTSNWFIAPPRQRCWKIQKSNSPLSLELYSSALSESGFSSMSLSLSDTCACVRRGVCHLTMCHI